MRRKIHYAWVILGAVILIRGLAGGGINMTSGLFLAPVASDIKTGIGTLSIYLSITSAVMVLWLPTAGKIINKFDVRVVAVMAAAFQVLSFCGMGFLNSVYGWYILAVPYAMGASLLVNLLGPILINRWFSSNVGMLLGIQMAFVGVFGAALQPAASRIIESRGWRQAYFVIGGAVFAVVVIIALVFLRNRPSDMGTGPYAPGEDKTLKRRTEDMGIGEKKAVSSASFFLLLLFMTAITGVGVFTQHIPNYGALLGYSVKDTGTALAFASVGNALGSVAIGIVSDRIGSLKTCFGMLGVGAAAVVLFLFGGAGQWIFYIAAFGHGLVSSGIMVLSPLLTLKFYGKKDYEKIFAKVSMGAPLASILFVPLYGFVYDYLTSYVPVLWGLFVLLAVSAVCITVGEKKAESVKNLELE